MRVSPGIVILLCITLLLCINLFGLYQRYDYLMRTPPSMTPRQTETFAFSFAGDIMAHDVNYLNPSYDEIYRGVTAFLQEDLLSFANLEFPVDNSKPLQNYPHFNVHSAYVDAAVEAGFQVFSAANNHSADQGSESIAATAAYLNKLADGDGIRWSGLRAHADDPMLPELIEVKGMRIGFLAVTAFLNLEEGSSLVYRVNHNNPERRESFLKYIRSIRPGYDLFILSVHAGVEYASLPHRGKHEFFYQLIEAGVDIVWGHHPHVLQPHEVLTRPDGRRGIIINSAGNFISGQTWHMKTDEIDTELPARGEGAIYTVNLVRSPEKGLIICGVDAVPVVSYRDPQMGMIVRTYDDVLKDRQVNPKWKRFYHQRKEPFTEILQEADWRNLAP
ncbi:CapA family protein [Marispirochaeta sp.]|uniref:CapA family protein n=1 Tax=Marispirochaeta sp. TaxID=2038653 RepID=UPI0029C76AA1|nr:CapA family protein [Marispirochaeta sp.]